MPENDTLDPADPRPVLTHWATASAAERGAHGAAVKKWKAREAARAAERGDAQSAKAQSRMGAGDGRQDRDAANLATLQRIQAKPDALASDVIRAVEAEQRLLSKQQAEALAEAHGPLVALREALDAIPPHERVHALDGLLRVEAPS